MRPTITAICIAALAIAWPRPASACSIDSPNFGLTFHRFPETIPQGGVLALTASVHATTVEMAMARLTEFRVTRDDIEVPGALEVLTISSATTYDRLQHHDLILVWRPQQPLVIGDTLVLRYTLLDDFSGGEPISFTVTDEPTVIALPPVQAFGRAAQINESDRVCCEVGRDSCDQSSLCLPTHAEQVPSLSLDAARLAGTWPQGYLWAAMLDADGVPGPRLARPADPDPGLEIEDPPWASWPHEILFPADSPAPYCVVLGATSLVDGTTLVSDPLCVTADALDGFDALGPITLEPDLRAHALTRGRECLGDPVYEADGSPYPAVAEPKAGCRTTSEPAPPALLLLLLALGRSRRRTTGRPRDLR